jgi:hypothetical protein
VRKEERKEKSNNSERGKEGCEMNKDTRLRHEVIFNSVSVTTALVSQEANDSSVKNHNGEEDSAVHQGRKDNSAVHQGRKDNSAVYQRWRCVRV